eukprot:scaffold84463_cov72-Phaeocystis_antarctica.AAC.2
MASPGGTHSPVKPRQLAEAGRDPKRLYSFTRALAGARCRGGWAGGSGPVPALSTQEHAYSANVDAVRIRAQRMQLVQQNCRRGGHTARADAAVHEALAHVAARPSHPKLQRGTPLVDLVDERAEGFHLGHPLEVVEGADVLDERRVQVHVGHAVGPAARCPHRGACSRAESRCRDPQHRRHAPSLRGLCEGARGASGEYSFRASGNGGAANYTHDTTHNTHTTHEHTRRTRARYPHTRATAARLIRLHHQRCAGQDPLVRIHRRAQRPREDEGRPAHRRRVKGADVPADRRAQQDVSEPQCTRLLDQPPYMQRNARPLLPDLARLGGASTYP